MRICQKRGSENGWGSRGELVRRKVLEIIRRRQAGPVVPVVADRTLPVHGAEVVGRYLLYALFPQTHAPF